MKDLESEIRAAILSAEKDARELAASNLLKALVANTPIDTGNARAHWVKSVANDSVIISNDAPYIEQLNAGSSKQAPMYFVEKTAIVYGKPVGTIVDYKG